MYTDKINAINAVVAADIDTLTATGVHTTSYIIQSQCKINRILGTVAVLTALDTISAVVTFKRRPVPGSAAGEVSIGTLTFGDALAVKTTLYKDVSPVIMYPGEQLIMEVTTAGTDSGVAAGSVYYGFEGEEDPEYKTNQTNMVASA